MSWILFLAATLVLVLQGCSYLLVKGLGRSEHRYAGALAILLAVLGVVLYVLFATGALLVSTEFRLAMVEGTAAATALCFLIAGFSIATALGWHLVRLKKELPSRGLWILGMGAICGILTATRVRMLSPESVLSPEKDVRYLDRWWPIMVVWLAVCISESLITLLGVRDRWARIWANMLLPVGLALYAVHLARRGFRYADHPWTRDLWETALLLGLPALMASGTFLVVRKWATPSRTVRRWLIVLVSGASGIWGLISASIWIYEPGRTASRVGSLIPRLISAAKLPLLLTPWFLWLASVALLGFFTAKQLMRPRRAGNIPVPDLGRPRVLDAIACLMIVLIAAFFADAVHFGRLPPTLDLVVVVVAWAVLLEVAGGGPLRALLEPPLIATYRKIRESLGRFGRTFGALLKTIFIGNSTGGAILRLAALVVLLVVFSELPDKGKTIVLPFSTPDVSDEEKKQGELGRFISDRILNTLGSLAQDLEPELIIYLPHRDSEPNAPGSRGNRPKIIQASEETNPLPVTSEVEILGARVPANLLTRPILDPMRRMLRVRVIHGSLEREGKNYTLLASASGGETWRVSREAGPTLNDPDSRKVIESLADEIAYNVLSSDPSLARFGMTASPNAVSLFSKGVESWNEYDQHHDFAALEDCIFHLREAIREDSQFALAHYRLGLALTENRQPLQAAEAFLAALRVNPHFSAARLALAKVDYFFDRFQYPLPPALRETQDAGASVKGPQPPPEEALDYWRQVIRSSRAEGSTAERAEAYSGLCRDALQKAMSVTREESSEEDYALHKALSVIREERSEEDALHKALSVTREERSEEGKRIATQAYLGFFYCRKAEDLYSGLPGSSRENFTFANQEATVLYFLGQTLETGLTLEQAGQQQREPGKQQEASEKQETKLEQAGQQQREPGKRQEASEKQETQDVSDWHCSVAAFDDEDIELDGRVKRSLLQKSFFGPEIQRYYERAQALLPQDAEVACTYASARLSGDRDPAPMEELSHSPAAHLRLAQELSDRAARARALAAAATEFDRLAADLDKGGFHNTAQAFRDIAAKRRRAARAAAADPTKFDGLALDEYNRGLHYAQDADTLNDYAYTFWLWKSANRLKGACPPPREPKEDQETDICKKALDSAREAVRLTSGNTYPSREAMIRSTLGEVLLGESKFEDAIEELRKAYDFVRRSRSAAFNEIRLDLAQAYYNRNNCRPDPAARELLDEIRGIESTGDAQPYSSILKLGDVQGPLETEGISILCEAPLDGELKLNAQHPHASAN